MSSLKSKSSKNISTSRSAPFTQVRNAHRLEAAEDYTELISDLIDAHGVARTGAIANALGVSHVTASRTIQRLQQEGYVETAPRLPVTLTTKGKRLAAKARERHQLVVALLTQIGVPDHIAEADAEGVEHHISETTLSCIKDFLER